MNVKKLIGAALFAIIANGAFASESEGNSLSWAPGDGISYNETSILSTEATLNFHSKYMSYGVVYGNDPILVPGVCATFFDWAYIGVESIFDLTKGNYNIIFRKNQILIVVGCQGFEPWTVRFGA